MELTKLRLEFDEIIGYNNREFNDILWAWVKRNANNISNLVEAPVILQKGENINIKIYRDDNIEGFAAYCAQDKNETKTILMNVYATFTASVENDIDAKEFIIQNLMHEFGHALEEYYNKNFDEDFIEKAVQTYFDKYHPDSPLSK